MGVFKGYDVRGVYGKDITEAVARELGSAFSAFLGNEGSVAVNRDQRVSSPSLAKELIEGLAAGGANVFDVGMAPTPVGYFAGAFLKADATVSVTASHHPPEFNGFKFCKNNLPLSSEELNALEKIFVEKRFGAPKNAGKVVERDIAGDYVDFVAGKVGKTNLKIVVDSGNGSAGPVAVALLEKIGCEVVGLYTEPDGTCPNHPADPHERSTLADLQKKVVAEKAGLGVALDGDGDRVYFIDELGRIMLPDAVAVLLARDYLKRQPGAVIPFELRCSLVLPEEIRKNGGKPLMTAAGRIAVRQAVAENKSPFGTESTGHMCFGDVWGFDDGLFGAAKFASLIAGKKASELAATVPKYFTSVEYRIKVPASRKEQIVFGVKRDFAKRFPLNELDGVRIETRDYWGLLRPSQNDALLSLRFEGKTRGHLELIYGVFKDALAKQKVVLPPLQE